MEAAQRRLGVIVRHVTPLSSSSPSSSSCLEPVACSSKPSHNIRWNGWGFADTEFRLNSNGQIELTGSRYLFSGHVMPNFRPWVEKEIGLDVSQQLPIQQKCPCDVPLRNEAFLSAVEGKFKRITFDDEERVFHGHGHSCQEIYQLRWGRFPRVPDVVIYPGQHEHVEAIVAAAVEHNVVLIPFGGGTNVSQALLCPEKEQRMIVSLDMREMNRIKWVNHEDMLACIEAGAVGRILEKELGKFGVCMGHEPDSVEFSTLGGWISTRASGMKKNVYGNIEDIVVTIKFVTPKGTMEKTCHGPRTSIGPDVNEFVLGSEGTFGVVTEAVVKVRPLPPVRRYGSIIFPDFEPGCDFMYQVAKKRLQPASIRLMDNMQFQFGMALKPAPASKSQALVDKAKKFFITQVKGFQPDRLCAVTLTFEGSEADVAAHEEKIYSLAARYNGLKAGGENGERGYFLTFMIAYLRDFAFQFKFIAESFETSVPWHSVSAVCKNVKERIARSCADRHIQGRPFVSCRVTQLYDSGACIYFYFGFLFDGVADPVATFTAIEEEAREEILALGGSLSHHHGVGKLRKQWYGSAVSEPGRQMYRALKASLDPKNIFANGNLD